MNQVDDRVSSRAKRLDDPRLERVRNPNSRRKLVIAMCALLFAEAALFAMAELAPFVLLSGAVVLTVLFVLCLGALKASTRGVEELPRDALDERQVHVRGEVYSAAYGIGRALLMLELALVVGWLMLDLGAPPVGVVCVALLLPFQVSLVLPTMVAATRKV